MGLKFNLKYRKLKFLFDAGTSRGVLAHKDVWFITVCDTANRGVQGIGEAGPLQGLSIDDVSDFEFRLKKELQKLENADLPTSYSEVIEIAQKVDFNLPSVKFGVETALLDLLNGGVRKYFSNQFYDKGKPVKINGLIWMGNSQLMHERLNKKIKEGFSCIKVKIGAIKLEDELHLLESVRNKYKESELELRVDANGAFSYEEAAPVLAKLKQLRVHSIEQPIKAGQRKLMAKLCKKAPIPIALDEELIGIVGYTEKKKLLQEIKPQFIILKPSLLGGFNSCNEWIEIAESLNIGWWLTSALESNIGLNAICQFASSLNVSLPQGLGTGGLYANNIESPLRLKRDTIFYDRGKKWGGLVD